MEEYGKILLIAMPAFLFLVAFEKLYGYFRNNDTMPLVDAVSSLSSGLSNVVKDVLGLSINIITYQWLVVHIAIYHIEETWLMYVIAFIVIDFYGYWSHRFDHEINFFWNEHIIHHSSEEFNLACALRQPVSGIVRVFNFLLIPAALVGIPENVIAVVLPLHLFAQFWYHTRHIGRMGFMEYIIVTPSHHRVHHAMNPEYLDKNYGQIFIFWDRLFGTYQEEKAEITPVYGITRPANTWNPFIINYKHLALMLSDAWRAPKLIDKLRIWFMPTGWRPAGFEDKYPVKKVTDVYRLHKYQSYLPKPLFYWSIAQLFGTLILNSHLFGNIASIGTPGIFVYGFFNMLTIYCFTDLMDRNRFNWIFELVRIVFAIVILIYFNSWFGLIGIYVYLLLGYLGTSFLISLYYSQNELTPQNTVYAT